MNTISRLLYFCSMIHKDVFPVQYWLGILDIMDSEGYLFPKDIETLQMLLNDREIRTVLQKNQYSKESYEQITVKLCDNLTSYEKCLQNCKDDLSKPSESQYISYDPKEYPHIESCMPCNERDKQNMIHLCQHIRMYIVLNEIFADVFDDLVNLCEQKVKKYLYQNHLEEGLYFSDVFLTDLYNKDSRRPDKLNDHPVLSKHLTENPSYAAHKLEWQYEYGFDSRQRLVIQKDWGKMEKPASVEVFFWIGDYILRIVRHENLFQQSTFRIGMDQYKNGLVSLQEWCSGIIENTKEFRSTGVHYQGNHVENTVSEYIVFSLHDPSSTPCMSNYHKDISDYEADDSGALVTAREHIFRNGQIITFKKPRAIPRKGRDSTKLNDRRWKAPIYEED